MPKITVDIPGDQLVEASRIQQEIKDYLGLDSDELMFEFTAMAGYTKLDLITINPRHNQSFLFHSLTGGTKVDVLKKMFEYVKNFREKENSYTIQWVMGDKGNLHTSYFRASSILEALEKLYYGRDRGSITVFSVVLNPVA